MESINLIEIFFEEVRYVELRFEICWVLQIVLKIGSQSLGFFNGGEMIYIDVNM